MNKIFFEQLRLPEPDKFLGVGLQLSYAEEQIALLIKKQRPKNNSILKLFTLLAI
jgi:hypothetical protein